MTNTSQEYRDLLVAGKTDEAKAYLSTLPFSTEEARAAWGVDQAPKAKKVKKEKADTTEK